jgi:beta-lactamase regulating signal transducer with metallopeptidase domain
MNSALLTASSYALTAAWQVALFCTVGWSICRLTRSAGPVLQHRIWTATLLLAIVVPAMTILRPHLVADIGLSGLRPVSADSTAVRVMTPQNTDLVVSSTVSRLVAGLYLGALAFFAIRLGAMIYITARMIRRSHPMLSGPEADGLWQRAIEAFGVHSAALRLSPDVSGPVATGFRSPVLLFPERFFESHSRTEVLAAMGHECAHIQRRDFWKNLFYESASLLVAFHPLTWVIKARIAGTREMVCDRMAADRLLERHAYAHSLLALASTLSATRRPLSQAIGMFDARILEQRILALTNLATTMTSARRRISAAASISLLVLCAVASWSLAPAVTAQVSGSAPAAALGQVLGRTDLACTYYGFGQDRQFKGHPGTCWVGNDEHAYRCFMNEIPSQSNAQSACASKVRRALGTK